MDEDRRRAPRKEISSTVEFVVDDRSILQAIGIDISETGIGFDAAEPLTVALVVNVDEEEVTRHARLARVERTEEGTYLFGLEFVEPLEDD